MTPKTSLVPAALPPASSGPPARSKTASTIKSPGRTKNTKACASSRKPTKAPHHTSAFSTLRSRQQAVERAKLQIWRHLPKINGAVIKLAESGSYLAARTLFEFAGVYVLPPLEEPIGPTVPATPGEAASSESTQPVNRVEAFLQSLGLDPLSDEEPEPDMAA